MIIINYLCTIKQQVKHIYIKHYEYKEFFRTGE